MNTLLGTIIDHPLLLISAVVIAGLVVHWGISANWKSRK
jgi:hypothetical protein